MMPNVCSVTPSSLPRRVPVAGQGSSCDEVGRPQVRSCGQGYGRGSVSRADHGPGSWNTGGTPSLTFRTPGRMQVSLVASALDPVCGQCLNGDEGVSTCMQRSP